MNDRTLVNICYKLEKCLRGGSQASNLFSEVISCENKVQPAM